MATSWKPPQQFDFTAADEPAADSSFAGQQFDFDSEPDQARALSFDHLTSQLKPITANPGDSFNWMMSQAARVGQSAGWLVEQLPESPLGGALGAMMPATKLIPEAGQDIFNFGSDVIGQAMQDRSKASSDYWLDRVGEDFKTRAQAGLDDPEFGVTTLYAAALGSLPEMMLTMGTGAVAGKLASLSTAVTTAKVAEAAARGSVVADKMLRYAKYAPVVAGAAAGGATEGMLAAGASGVAMEARVNDMTHEELISGSDRYLAVYDAAAGMAEEDRRQYAKRTIAEEMARATASWVGLSTALLGAPTGGFMGYLGGKASKRVGADAAASMLERSVAGQAATGFVAEGSQEFLQEGSQQFLENLGLREYADRRQSITEGVRDNAVIGGLVGGFMGGSITPLVGGAARKNARAKKDAAGSLQDGEFKYSRNPILEARIVEQLQQMKEAGVPAGELQKVFRWSGAAGGRSSLEFSKALEQLLETGKAPDDIESTVGEDYDDNGMLTEAAYNKDASRFAFDIDLKFKPTDEQKVELAEALAADGANPYVMGDGSFVIPNSKQGAGPMKALADSIKRRTGIDYEIIDHEEAKRAATEGAQRAVSTEAEGAKTASSEEAVLIPHDLDEHAQALPEDQRPLLSLRYQNARQSKPAFDETLESIASNIGASTMLTPLKSAKRAVEKVVHDLGGQADKINDLVRGTIVVDTVEDAGIVLRDLQRSFDVLDSGYRDTLTNDFGVGPDGYRDIKVNVDLGDGLVGEVQVHLSDMAGAKEAAHALYERRSEILRAAGYGSLSPQNEAEVNQLNRKMAEVYGPAFESSLRASGNLASKRSASSGAPLRYAEAKAKGRGASPSSASTRSPDSSRTSATGTPSTSQSRSTFIDSSPDPDKTVAQVDVARKEVAVRDAAGLEEMGRSAASHPDNDYDEPTERQLAAGNYPKGHGVLKGATPRENVRVSIENVPGSIRRAIGGGWSRKMKHWYGYILGAKSADGDLLDVYLGRNAHNSDLPVFVVRQLDSNTGAFDESKVVMGYANEAEAKNAYLSEYPRELHDKLFGGITRMSRDQFAMWLESGDTDVAPNPMTKAPMLSLRKRTTSHLLRTLTPTEQKKITDKVAEKVLAHLDNMPSSDEMAAIAFAGRAKRGWYQKSAQAIVDIFGPDAPRFAGLLAAMSPQTSVQSNLRNALNTWKNWTAAGRPQDRNTIFAIMGASVEGGAGEYSVLPAWVNNSVRALTAEDPSQLMLSGPKVNSFAHNLMGDVNEVTNDTWMANWAMVDQTIFKGSLTKTDSGKVPGYLAMSALTRDAAEILTEMTGEQWTPAEVQETVWSWAKSLYELADSAGEIRSAVDLVKDGAITDELIASTPDFGSLFTDSRYASILEGAGYDEQIKRLRYVNDTRRAVAEKLRTGEQAVPFDRDSQEAHEVASAKRLDALRTGRPEVTADIPFSLRNRNEEGPTSGTFGNEAGPGKSNQGRVGQSEAGIASRSSTTRGPQLSGVPRFAQGKGRNAVSIAAVHYGNGPRTGRVNFQEQLDDRLPVGIGVAMRVRLDNMYDLIEDRDGIVQAIMDSYGPSMVRDMDVIEETITELGYDGFVVDGEAVVFDAKSAIPVSNVDALLASLSKSNVTRDFMLENPRRALERPGWAVVTATQESVGDATASANVYANNQLRGQLLREGIEFIPVAGTYQGVDQGANFMIFATESKALELGRAYGQESVLTNRGLVYTDGRVTPALHDQSVFGETAMQQDFFSTLPNGKSFSMGLDWDAAGVDTVAEAVAEQAPADTVGEDYVAKVLDIVDTVAGSIKGGPEYSVIKNELELAYHPLKHISDMGAVGQVEGFFDPTTSKVVIIANNIQLRKGETLTDAVERIYAEESLGHFGLAAVFGERAMNVLFDQVWNDHKSSPAMRRVLEDYMGAYGDPSSKSVRRRMANEFLSKADPDTHPTLWKKLVAWAREQLRRIGFVRSWSDNDLSVLMDRVFNAVRDGEVPTSLKKLGKALVRIDGLRPTVVVGDRVTTYGEDSRTVKDKKFEATFDDGMEGDVPAAEVYEFHGSIRALASFLSEEGKKRIVFPDGLVSEDMLRAAELPFYPDAGAIIVDIPEFSGEPAPMFSLRNRQRGSDEVETILSKTIQMHESEMGFGQRMKQWARELTGYFGDADTWLELKTGWVDSAASIEKLERGLFDGKLLDASESAYKMISLTKNLPQLMSAVSRAGVPEYRDGSFHIVKGRKGLYEIFNPLFHTDSGKNLLHLWEGYAVARRSSQLINQTNPDGTSKEKLLAPDEIAKLLALESEYPVFRKVFDEWQEFNRQLLDLAVDRGALDKEMAGLWKQNDYVPFFRVDEDEDVAAGITRKRGLSGQRVTSKRLTGSDMRIQPVLENIMMNTASIIEKVYKNEAMNRIVALGDGVVMEREPMRVEAVKLSNEDIARQLAKAGLFVGDNSNSTPEQRRANKMIRNADLDFAIHAVEQMTPEQKERWSTFFRRLRPEGNDIVSVMVAGKPVYYRVTDPLVMRAIMDMTPVNFGGLVDFMGGAKRLLTTMVTLDPGFMAANWMRDTLSSWAVVNEDFRPFRDAPKGAAEIWMESGLAVDLAMAGGMTGGFYNPTQDFGDVMHEVAGATVLNSPKKLLDTYRKIGMVSEQVNRMAIARGVLRRGGSMAEAAYQAQDVLNFSQTGDAVAAQLLIRTVPFLNARIQGLYRLWKGAKGLDGRDPKKAALAFLLKGLFLAGLSMLLALRNRGDERYEKLPDYQKDTYWHFFIGDSHYAVPKPFEVGTLFATLPERAMRLLAKDDSAKTTVASIQRSLMDTFAFNPVPQLFKPIVEQWANRSFFTDRPIVGLELEGLEPQAQYNPWTSETARGMATMMDAVVPDGMRRFVPETMRSPVRLEHAMRAYLGTMGGYILQLSDAALRQTGAFPEAPAMSSVRDIPVLGGAAGRFVRGDPELESGTKYADDLYAALGEADDAYRTLNAYIMQGNLEAAQKLTERRVDALSVRPILHDFRQAAADINRQQRLIMISDMTPDEKRVALDELTRTKNRLMREAVPYLGLMDY